MTTGTFPTWTSCVAASTATLPWLCESRVSVTSLQPFTPPASLMSRNAISTDFAPAWPYSPAGPVSSMTTPTVISQSCACAKLAVASKAGRGVSDKSTLAHDNPSRSLRGTSVVLVCFHPGFLQMAPLRRRAAPPDWQGKARSTACGSSVPSRYCCSVYSSKTASSPAQIARGSSTDDREIGPAGCRARRSIHGDHRIALVDRSVRRDHAEVRPDRRLDVAKSPRRLALRATMPRRRRAARRLPATRYRRAKRIVLMRPACSDCTS